MKLHEAWLPTRDEALPFLIDADGRSITFGSFLAEASALEAKLRRCGVGNGDRVLVVYSSLLTFIAAVTAASRLGAVFVPLDPGFNSERNRLIRTDANAKVSVHSLNELELHSVADGPTMPPNIAGLFYSSGSSGIPKGVMLSHENLIHVARELAAAFDMAAGHRELLISRPTHLDGWQRLSACLYAKGTIIEGSALGLASLAAQVQYHAANGIYLPQAIAEAASGINIEFSQCLKSIETGSARFRPTTIEFLKNAAPWARVFHHYGLTECSRATLLEVKGEWSPADCGPPLRGVSVEIRENDQIWLKGPQLAQGYWNQETLTRERFQCGWFRTGDAGELGPGGSLHFRGRLDDLMERWGSHFYPAEAEREFLTFPEVECCSYFSIAGGKTVAVVKVSDKTDEVSIERKIRSSLPPAIRPDAIFFNSEFPRLPSGKANRPALLAWASEKYGEGI